MNAPLSCVTLRDNFSVTDTFHCFAAKFKRIKTQIFLALLLMYLIPTVIRNFALLGWSEILINAKHFNITIVRSCYSLLFSSLKVSKYQKQIILSSHTSKNQWNFSHFFALASKSGRIKKIKVLNCCNFIFCFNNFLGLFRSQGKKMWKIPLVFWVWEDKIIWFWDLLSFRWAHNSSILYFTRSIFWKS